MSRVHTLCVSPRALLIMVTAGLLVSGCMADETRRPSFAQAPQAGAGTDMMATGAIRSAVPEQALPGNAALAELPAGAGMAEAVRERIFGNGAYQDIRMDGPAPHGANVLEVAVQTDANPVRRDLAVPLNKPSEQGIRAEIQARFPDLRMQIIPKPMENSFGPFGLAIGRYADGTRCLYAWQYIEDFRPSGKGESSFSRLADSWSRKSGSPASVRLRLCRPDISVDELASYMQGLSVGDPGNIERVRAARNVVDPSNVVMPVAAGRGEPSVITAGNFVPDGSLESALGPEPVRQQAAARAAPVYVAKPRHAAAPAAGRPTAPYVAKARSAAKPVSQVARVKPEPKADDTITPYSGPYLAPVAGAATSSAQPQLSAPAYRSNSLNSGLPPQAFRGPTASYNPSTASNSIYGR